MKQLIVSILQGPVCVDVEEIQLAIVLEPLFLGFDNFEIPLLQILIQGVHFSLNGIHKLVYSRPPFR